MPKKVKTTRKQGTLQKNLSLSLNYIKDSRRFIYSVCFVFFAAILMGAFIPTPAGFSEKIMDFINQLVDQTQGMGFFGVTKFIFFNNVQSSFTGMIFGILFGVFSVFVAFFNGYLLGFVALKAVNVDGIFVLWKLVPHGIFELPALLISLGLGLKLGTFILQKKKAESFRVYLLNSLRTFFFVVVPLLLIAGIIEGALIAFLG